MNIQTELYDRVVLNEMSDEDVARILSHKLERFFAEKIKVKNKFLYERIQSEIENQKVRNLIFKEEVIRISKYFCANNVRVVQLKGVVLADDLGINDSGIRKCNDIDILVAPEDTKKALALLGELGYKVESEKQIVSAELKDKYYHNVIFGAIHFPRFYVEVSYNRVKSVIRMDFHIAIAHTMTDKERKMNNLVWRSEEQIFFGSKVYVLEIHDRFVHLAMHYTKEMLRNEMRWCIIGTRKIENTRRLNMALLHDMALLVNKYQNEIDWGIIQERAKEFDALDEVAFVNKCLNWVYPSLNIPEIDMEAYDDEMYEIKRKGAYYPIQLAHMNVKDVLTKSMKELSKDILKMSECREEVFYAHEKYFIGVSCEDNIVGCKLSKYKTDAIGEIEFEVGNDIIFRIYLKDKEKYSYVTFSIGSSSPNNIFNAFINKFRLNLKDYNSFHNSYSLSINNKYVQATFFFLAEAKEEFIEIHLPSEIVGKEVIEKKEFLFDIDLPELYNVIQLRQCMVPKFKLNDISFPYNPDILHKIVIKENYDVSCIDVM